MSKADGIEAIGDRQVQLLVARLMLHSSQANTHLLNQLVKSYQREFFELRAELELIRDDILRALSGPYMANPDLIRVLLRPEPARIAVLAESRLAEVKASVRPVRKGKKAKK